MAELNLKQMVDKWNTEFTGEHRRLVFWYDDKGDFVEVFRCEVIMDLAFSDNFGLDL